MIFYSTVYCAIIQIVILRLGILVIKQNITVCPVIMVPLLTWLSTPLITYVVVSSFQNFS